MNRQSTDFWERNLILRVLSGSRAYGLDDADSGQDTRGICIPLSSQPAVDDVEGSLISEAHCAGGHSTWKVVLTGALMNPERDRESSS